MGERQKCEHSGLQFCHYPIQQTTCSYASGRHKYSIKFYTFVWLLSILSFVMQHNIARSLHLLDNYGILCSQVRCCLGFLRHLFKTVLPHVITVGRIPLVVGNFFCCGCAVCMRNAVRRIPQIDNDPVIHTFPCWSVACLLYQQGRVLHTVASAQMMGRADQAEG